MLHFKSHPLTGSVDVRYQVAEQNIIERARRLGGEALVMTPGLTLYDYFEQTDLLITDVSSVISDFLYLERPVIVTNPLASQDMAGEFPVVRACYVLAAEPFNLEGLLEDIAGIDRRSSARTFVRQRIFGVPRGSSVSAFRE